MAHCPNCGEESPDRARFCWNCGTELQRGEIREERRLVTVLFADLVGFTERSDHADPEDVKGLLRPFHAGLKQTIERFGGSVDKFIGDAVLGVFGVPVTHEDDPERAVRTSLAILDEIAVINQAHPGLDIRVRVGVDSGEAMVSFGSGPMIGEALAGDVVNTASRLQGVAPVGGIVVGEATFRATDHAIEYERLDPVSVKGKAERVPIWRVRGARSRSPSHPVPADAPFVGRAGEIERLHALAEIVASEGGSRGITLVGEPGIGKTRLLVEVARAGAEPMRWIRGRCLPYGEGVTFWAMREMVNDLAMIEETDGQETAARKLRDAVARVEPDPDERGWIVTGLEPLLGVAPDRDAHADRGELFTIWRRYLEREAQHAPLAVVVEDVHWASEQLLEFLRALFDPPPDAPLLVMVAGRPEFLDTIASTGAMPWQDILRLDPLARDETARLIAELLGRPVLDATTQETLLARAEGNPLYAEQFVRMLADRGLDPDAAGELAFPGSLQSLIASRLDALSPQERDLVQDASVVGRSFWLGATTAIETAAGESAAGETTAIETAASADPAPIPSTVQPLVDELVSRQLLRPSLRPSLEGHTEYEFVHAVVRDVAYARIPRLQRARKHHAVARWLEAATPDATTDRSEVLAYHYAEALSLARAARSTADVEELVAPARRFLELAGDRAMGLDVGRAEELFRAALELVPDEDPTYPLVLFKLGGALHHTGHLEESAGVFEEAIVRSERGGDLLASARTRTRFAVALWYMGETARSHDMLVRAVEILDSLDAPADQLASTYTELAGDRLTAGRSAEALTWADRALAIARQHDLRAQLVKTLDYRGLARCDLGDMRGLEDMREALALARELNQGRDVAVLQGNLAGPLWASEGPAAALEAFGDAIDTAERRGMTGLSMWLHGNTLRPLFDLGRWDDVLTTADEVIEAAGTRNSDYAAVYALVMRAGVVAARGDPASAAARAQEFLPRARAIDEPQILIGALATAAVAALGIGRDEEARLLVEEAEESSRDRPNWDLPPNLPELIRVAVGAGALDAAKRLLDGHLESPPRLHLVSIRTGRALLSEALGDDGDALAAFLEVVESWRALGMDLEAAQAQLGAARMLQRLDRAEEAAPLLGQARATFERLGATLLAAQAEALGNAA